jgi:enoyl-CoA hydratase/carnithine racemase
VADRIAGEAAARAVILRGAGERAFCAGADLIERQSLAAEERSGHTESILQMVEQVAAIPVPVIAAIRGYALAGGAELAIGCDLRFAAGDAVLGFPEVRIGIFPGAGGVARLPHLIGPSAAADLLYTGRQVLAEEALALGLVDRVLSPGEELEAAMAKAREIAAAAPLAVRAVKQALRTADGLPVAAANQAVKQFRGLLDASRDYEEGLAAFAEKRPPRFTGS